MKVYTIRIVYKSGYTHDFDVTEFSINNGNFEWVAASVCNKPILLGASEVAAVYQIGVKEV